MASAELEGTELPLVFMEFFENRAFRGLRKDIRCTRQRQLEVLNGFLYENRYVLGLGHEHKYGEDDDVARLYCMTACLYSLWWAAENILYSLSIPEFPECDSWHERHEFIVAIASIAVVAFDVVRYISLKFGSGLATFHIA